MSYHVMSHTKILSLRHTSTSIVTIELMKQTARNRTERHRKIKNISGGSSTLEECDDPEQKCNAKNIYVDKLKDF